MGRDNMAKFWGGKKREHCLASSQGLQLSAILALLNLTTTVWETVSQNHLAESFPNSWLTKIVRNKMVIVISHWFGRWYFMQKRHERELKVWVGTDASLICVVLSLVPMLLCTWLVHLRTKSLIFFLCKFQREPGWLADLVNIICTEFLMRYSGQLSLCVRDMPIQSVSTLVEDQLPQFASLVDCGHGPLSLTKLGGRYSGTCA